MKNTLAIFVCTVLIYMISFTLIINDSMAQTNESQKFTVIKEFDKGQIRYYPPVMKIQSNNNFSSLFN
jgi:hypothetical protein